MVFSDMISLDMTSLDMTFLCSYLACTQQYFVQQASHSLPTEELRAAAAKTIRKLRQPHREGTDKPAEQTIPSPLAVLHSLSVCAFTFV